MVLTHGANSLPRGFGFVEIGGRRYPTVKICDLIWMAENLDWNYSGTLAIGGIPNYTISTPHAYYYKNDEQTYGYNGRKYGLLYNQYAATQMAPYIPSGWRLPTSADANALVAEVGATGGSKLKIDKYWANIGTNDYRFNAPPSAATNTGSQWFFPETFFYCQSSTVTNSKTGILAIKDDNTVAYFADGASAWISMPIRLVKDA